jgi:sugar lactone lactonase YvrE
MTSGNPAPTPGAGSIVRIRPGGGPETIVDGLTLPTAMTVGPDGALYVSHIGFGPPIPGAGQILRIALH